MYTFSDGHQYYNGEWKNNIRHGHGLGLYKSGDIYEGGFVNNMQEGQGIHYDQGNWHRIPGHMADG